MSITSPPYQIGSAGIGEPIIASVGDYWALLKPRVMSLVVFTAFVGLAVAPVPMHPVLAVVVLLCVALGAGAAGAFNMALEGDIDARMERTRTRPIPSGRVRPGEAATLATLLAVGSTAMLGLFINILAAALLALTIAFYVVVYTIWLKPRTPENIVIGGAAGALPPLIGWAAATGSLALEPFVLFAIIFVWTPPHFWALAVIKAEDYRRAGIPMLPVVRDAAATRFRIIAYSVVLAPLGAAPALLGYTTPFYGILAAALGLAFVWFAWRLPRDGEGIARPAGQLFAYSILYLFVLFAAILVDRLLSGWIA